MSENKTPVTPEAGKNKAEAPAKSKTQLAFIANPNLDVVYEGHDGTPFFTENAARIYNQKAQSKAEPKRIKRPTL